MLGDILVEPRCHGALECEDDDIQIMLLDSGKRENILTGRRYSFPTAMRQQSCILVGAMGEGGRSVDASLTCSVAIAY